MLHKRKQSQDTLSSFGSLTIQPATANARQHGRNGSLSSPLPSPGLPPTATPSHAVEDGGSIKLHPEFQQEGNVLLACKDAKHQVGFTVNGNLIAAVCPTFRDLLTTFKSGPAIVWLDDSVDDIRIFLRLFGLATPVKGGMWEKSWEPTLYDYVASLRVVEKYDMVLLRDVLHNKVSTLPDEFVDNMGHSKNEVFAILHLAHVLQSRPLWENICSHMGRWRNTLDLHRLKDDEVEWLGPELHAILIAIAAMSMGSYPYADTHNIRVHYDHDGKASVVYADYQKNKCPNCKHH
ncbi:uncharacterized protein LOC62_07G009267 [Vanrija pseudolonga]|uniref:BTB domain-containing protein n=1 Tax=Vanrija pseudolonga TaxID=143232 RepID=A0AAF1BLF0_9TREE|nr:hypothetical protein LOC62_07G009267 [Vanrija pseudolonga]